MQILAVTLHEFKQFLELLIWIAVPLIVVSIAVTLAIHYWRKRKNTLTDAYDHDYSEGLIMPRAVGQDDNEQPTYNGMLWLRTKYHDDMATADERTENLRIRFFELEKKYNDLVELESLTLNRDHSEQHFSMDNSSVVDHETAMDELRARLEEAISQLSQFKQEHNDAKVEASALQERLTSEISQLQSVNQSKTVYINELEKDLSTLQRQSSEHISQLNEKLEAEMSKSYDLEQKVAFNQRLLQKIQEEISDSFDKQMILYTGHKRSDMNERNISPKISAWIESPSEEEGELEQIG